MIQHRQSFEQTLGKSRKKSFRATKVCWTVLLSTGLLFTQLTPVFARNGFNHPVVPGYAPSQPMASPPAARPAPSGLRFVSPASPAPRFRPPTPVPVVHPPGLVPPVGPPSPVVHPVVVSPPVIGPPLPVGRIFRDLPLGYAAIMLANSLYYYHAGAFYRPAPGGYIIIDAPVGAVIPALPADYSFLIVDGIRYYTHAGVYYLPVPEGYEVVADPRTSVPQPVISNRVMVMSQTLNVRSGPGLQYYIASRVYRGDMLLVLQREVDWLYVQLPDNNRGWVMTKFTAPSGQRADG